MNIELKVVKLTKSKIMQMQYIGIPNNLSWEVLGWVYLDKKRFAIVKSADCYYRADCIRTIESEIKDTQFESKDGGWQFPHVTHITVRSENDMLIRLSAKINENENIELLNELKEFKKRTDSAGQIYF